MTELSNDLFIRALLRQPVDRTPVWMMRQAGRYLPEYRATRERAGSFLDLCQIPELACEVSLQPLNRFELDAAIVFSDILTVPDAMGLGLFFTEGEGPQFERPIRTTADIDQLAMPDVEDDLCYVMQAVSLIRRELNGQVPLIGFSGSPWTLATYMIEGGTSKNFCQIKRLMYSDPAALHRLLALVADTVAAYLNAQSAAGAQVLMLFDTWGGVLTQQAFEEFSLAYMTRIVGQLIRERDGQRVPVILFTKGGGLWLSQMSLSGCDALGVDWGTDLGVARQQVGARVALQGNLDPCTLYAGPDRIRSEVKQVLESYGHGTGHIFNLGHGILPDIEPAHAAAMIQSVHDLSPAYHGGR